VGKRGLACMSPSACQGQRLAEQKRPACRDWRETQRSGRLLVRAYIQFPSMSGWLRPQNYCIIIATTDSSART